MHRPIAALLALIFVTAIAAPAFAQDETKTQFINLEHFIVNGTIKVPQAYDYDAQRRAKFDKLGKIEKKSFTAKSLRTTGSL